MSREEFRMNLMMEGQDSLQKFMDGVLTVEKEFHYDFDGVMNMPFTRFAAYADYLNRQAKEIKKAAKRR